MQDIENFDLMSTLTWGELAKVEEYLDVPMDEWTTMKHRAKLSLVMQYMLAKRDNPELTLEDAEKMTITDLSKLSGISFDAAPKEVTSA